MHYEILRVNTKVTKRSFPTILKTEHSSRRRGTRVGTFDIECVELEAAAAVGVCGDEEKVAANGEGGNIGGQLRRKQK